MYEDYRDPDYVERRERPLRRPGESKTWLTVALFGAALGIGLAKLQLVFAGTTEVFEEPMPTLCGGGMAPASFGPALPSDPAVLHDERAAELPAGARLVLRGRRSSLPLPRR